MLLNRGRLKHTKGCIKMWRFLFRPLFSGSYHCMWDTSRRGGREPLSHIPSLDPTSVCGGKETNLSVSHIPCLDHTIWEKWRIPPSDAISTYMSVSKLPGTVHCSFGYGESATRERERERETGRQAGRQAGRQTQTQTDRQTDRQTQTDRHRNRDRQRQRELRTLLHKD